MARPRIRSGHQDLSLALIHLSRLLYVSGVTLLCAPGASRVRGF